MKKILFNIVARGEIGLSGTGNKIFGTFTQIQKHRAPYGLLKIITVILLSTCWELSSATLPLDGNFTELDAEHLPKRWVQHKNWSGFEPYASIKIVPGSAGGENALRIFNTRAQYGACIRTAERLKGISGDTVTVTLKARGKGKTGT